jgi:hypothetical protein
MKLLSLYHYRLHPEMGYRGGVTLSDVEERVAALREC